MQFFVMEMQSDVLVLIFIILFSIFQIIIVMYLLSHPVFQCTFQTMSY